jgi:alpha-glucosidase
MTPLRRASLVSASGSEAVVALGREWRCRVALVAGSYGRVTLLPPDGYREPRTWAIAHRRDVPWEGLARDDATGFPAASCEIREHEDGIEIRGDSIRARLRFEPFGVTWHVKAGDDWAFACADRPSYAYAAATRTSRLVHSAVRDAFDEYYGLGDKTGPLDHAGRRLRTLQLDALGYDAATSDPLYKHWPFFAGRRADSGICYGIYYDTLSTATFDFGQELDNYHGFYRATEIDDGDLDCWFVGGPAMKDVVRGFVTLIGQSALPPRWALGYANTAMGLADAPDAQARVAGFLECAKAERIPLSSFHLGSGYSSRGRRRYVFTWNREKFPAPEELMTKFHDAGVRVVANVKPCLIDDHPAYREVAAAGGFVADATGAPCLGQFWDGWGAHVDFTHPAGIGWWQRGLTHQVLETGIDVGWNDNNEYEIWNEDALAHGFGTPLPMARARPLQALLMTRATYEAQRRHVPAERVYTVTRAGPPGIQRYAQTWTGDNTTSWKTLRWNQRMALTMGLSGMFDIGHDVGGFAGPVPDAELLVRWAQACALNPRFIMNSWKEDGSVNSPWLHAAATPHIRAAIELRLRLLPYLYTQRWLASVRHLPVLRPTFLEFPDDASCWKDNDEMMAGPDLLVAPVLDAGARERTVYLPRDAATPGWYEIDTGAWHAAGQTVTIAAPLDRLPLFVRAGSVVPVTKTTDSSRLTDEPSRTLRCFPVPAGVDAASRTSEWIEDDGISEAWRDGAFMRAELRLDGDRDSLRLMVARREGRGAFVAGPVRVLFSPDETRALTVRGEGLDFALEGP